MALSRELIMYTCPRCRGCIEATPPAGEKAMPICPAAQYGGFFSYSGGGRCYAAQGLLEGRLHPNKELMELVFQCTLCGACREVCLAGADPLEVAQQLRREMVEMGQGPPDAMKAIIRSTMEYQNPYLIPQPSRLQWLVNMQVPIAEEGNAKRIFYVGCNAALIPEHRDVARSSAFILKQAGVPFAVLGDKEGCCGATVHQLGDYRAFHKIVSRNMELFNKLGVEEIITACAEGYYTLKYLYPQVIVPKFKVFHISEVIYHLIKTHRLLFENGPDLYVTYHDPCYLGRYAGLYEAPRKILEAIPGVNLVEMPRNQAYSYCCGGGAGLPAGYPEFSSFAAKERYREAVGTGAQALVTSCTFCEGNLTRIADQKGFDILDLTHLVSRYL